MDQTYQSYRSAVRHGTPLSHEEFLRFWNSVEAEDREYWLAKFRAGNVALTKEYSQEFDDFLDNIGSGLHMPEVK